MLSRKQIIKYLPASIVAGVLLYQNYSLDRKLENLSLETTRFAEVNLAQRQTKNFYANAGLPRSRYICSNDVKNSNPKICEVLAMKSFDNLGFHDDLWVTLDAITVFADQPDLSKDIRRQLTKYYADLMAALSTDGAFQSLSRDADEKPAVYSNDVYDAIVSQVVICSKLPAYKICTNGLPNDVRAPLKNLINLVITVGPSVSPYEMNKRLDSAKRLISAGIV